MPLHSVHPRPTERFADRIDAGRRLGLELLAEGLVTHQDGETVVLGLPRGGVPVAAEVARALGATLDVLVVRKLGYPNQPELAMGALAPGDARVLNAEIAASVPSDAFERVVQRERSELERRQQRYRGSLPSLNLQGKRVVLVDDGVATGATMRAAIASVRRQAPARIIVAVPVGPADSLAQLAREADDLVCLSTPAQFGAISLWYDDFTQVQDEAVTTALRNGPAWAKIAAEPQPAARVIRPP